MGHSENTLEAQPGDMRAEGTYSAWPENESEDKGAGAGGKIVYMSRVLQGEYLSIVILTKGANPTTGQQP